VYRTQLLNDLVALDGKILEITGRAANAQSNQEFEAIIAELRKLRAERADILAKLDKEQGPAANT